MFRVITKKHLRVLSGTTMSVQSLFHMEPTSTSTMANTCRLLQQLEYQRINTFLLSCIDKFIRHLMMEVIHVSLYCDLARLTSNRADIVVGLTWTLAVKATVVKKEKFCKPVQNVRSFFLWFIV